MKKFRISKNTKSALFVFIIAFSAFFAFEPLFENLGQKAAQEFTVAIFGTIFAAVITMVLLSKQTETEEERNRNDKVFEQKILLYNKVIDTIQALFEKADGRIIKMGKEDIVQIEFLLVKMLMLGSDKTIFEFKNFYQTITNNYSAEKGYVTLSTIERQIMFRFADYCREELGLTDKNLEKEIFEDIVLQGEFASNNQFAGIDQKVVQKVKDIYGYLVFNLDIPNRNITHLPEGFKAYVNNIHNDDNCFLEVGKYEHEVYLTLNKDVNIHKFKTNETGGVKAILLEADTRDEFYQEEIEKLIKESFKHTTDK